MATGDTVLTDDSLIPRSEGLGIALTVPWYRSLWLSSVSDIAVAVGGQPVPASRLRAELDGRGYRIDELGEQWDVLWFIQDRLTVIVGLDAPAAAGTDLDVEVTVDLRLPYMQIAPRKYVTNHATNHGAGNCTDRTTLHAILAGCNTDHCTSCGIESHQGGLFLSRPHDSVDLICGSNDVLDDTFHR